MDRQFNKKLVGGIEVLADVMMKPGFIVFFVGLVVFWILWNTLAPTFLQIDGWPFQGLNLFMSALAGIQATVVGIATSKQSKKNDQIIANTEKLVEVVKDLLEVNNSIDSKNGDLIEKVVKMELTAARNAKSRSDAQNKILNHIQEIIINQYEMKHTVIEKLPEESVIKAPSSRKKKSEKVE